MDSGIITAEENPMDNRQDEVEKTTRLPKEPYSPPEIADLGEIVGFTGY
jgi:hypothetical protein